MGTDNPRRSERTLDELDKLDKLFLMQKVPFVLAQSIVLSTGLITDMQKVFVYLAIPILLKPLFICYLTLENQNTSQK